MKLIVNKTAGDGMTNYITNDIHGRAERLINAINNSRVRKADGAFFKKDSDYLRSYIRRMYNNLVYWVEVDDVMLDEKDTLIRLLPFMDAKNYTVLATSIISQYVTAEIEDRI